MPTSYEDLKKKYDTSYYDEAINKNNALVNADTASQIQAKQQMAQSQLRQAYINRMQNQAALNNSLAQAGIRGGATETSNLKLMTNYGNQRSAVNSELGSSINEINANALQTKQQYANEVETARREYLENRMSEDRAYRREQIEKQASATAGAVTNANTAKSKAQEYANLASKATTQEDAEKYQALANAYNERVNYLTEQARNDKKEKEANDYTRRNDYYQEQQKHWATMYQNKGINEATKLLNKLKKQSTKGMTAKQKANRKSKMEALNDRIATLKARGKKVTKKSSNKKSTKKSSKKSTKKSTKKK